MNKKFTRALIAPVAAVLALAWGPARAADWPERPIMLVLPAGAGGSSDPLARLLGVELATQLNASVVVQNRPGAGGNVGMAQVSRAQPDGYTIILSWTGPMATNLALYKQVGYDPRADFAPVGMVGCTPNVLAVGKNSPAKDLKGFLAYAKEKTGKLSYGSTGVGSSWHISGEMVNQLVGGNMAHIPYQTPGAALTDLEGGRLDAMFPVVPMTVPHVQSGDLRVLAVFSETRASVLPDVPTTGELGHPELISDTCFAVLAPKGVSGPTLVKLNTALNNILKAPGSRKKIEDMGVQIRSGAPADVSAYLDREIPRQAELVRAAGATAQ